MSTAIALQKKATIMNSPFSIQAYFQDSERKAEFENLVTLAFAEVRRIEDLLTDFRDSPFNQINKNAGLKPTQVSHEIFRLIEYAIEISQESAGAFDISFASVGQLWRQAKITGVVPAAHELERMKPWVNYKLIEMNPQTREVYLPHPDMRIGLGGVGKGYAVDQAFAMLIQGGLRNVMVNGAGDIRVASAADAIRPWKIAVRNPFAGRDTAMGYFPLSKGAVATSGDYERYFCLGDKKYHHVFDARSKEFTERVASVTLIAETALIADLYATTVMALGPEEGLAFLNRRKHVYGFVMTQDGQILKSDNFANNEVLSYVGNQF